MKKITLSILAVATLFAIACTQEETTTSSTTAKVTTGSTTTLATTPKKFLFDATKAETAGNADWILDADSTNPQRIPTPAQSGITATTPESYWRGGLSSWGVALAKLGHTVETLPSGTAITYGGTGVQDLKNYDVFCETSLKDL